MILHQVLRQVVVIIAFVDIYIYSSKCTNKCIHGLYKNGFSHWKLRQCDSFCFVLHWCYLKECLSGSARHGGFMKMNLLIALRACPLGFHHIVCAHTSFFFSKIRFVLYSNSISDCILK